LLIISTEFLSVKERRNASSRNRSFKQRRDDIDEDDDDKNEFDKIDESVTNIRERRFRQFASIEYNDEIFMVVYYINLYKTKSLV
jgi:hypothetical protein